MNKKTLLFIIPFLLFLGCQQPTKSNSNNNSQLANPASTNCINKGGQIKIENKLNQGGQYGLCIFEDNRQCEEWALYNEKCPIGGLKITGYTTDAARYCVITGNKFTPGSGDSGTCTLDDGKSCDIQEFYLNHCINSSSKSTYTPMPNIN